MPYNPEGCDNDLVVLIENDGQDFTFIYDLVKTCDISISSSPSQYGIPFGTKLTDNIVREMDNIRLSGVIGCIGCQQTIYTPHNVNFGINNSVLGYVISELKRLSEKMIYDNTGFTRLTSNHWSAENMILTSCEVRHTGDNVQEMLIDTTWVGANLVGTIAKPNYKRGGLNFFDIVP